MAPAATGEHRELHLRRRGTPPSSLVHRRMRRPLSSVSTSSTDLTSPATVNGFDSLHDLLAEAGYKETRILTPSRQGECQDDPPASPSHSLLHRPPASPPDEDRTRWGWWWRKPTPSVTDQPLRHPQVTRLASPPLERPRSASASLPSHQEHQQAPAPHTGRSTDQPAKDLRKRPSAHQDEYSPPSPVLSETLPPRTRAATSRKAPRPMSYDPSTALHHQERPQRRGSRNNVWRASVVLQDSEDPVALERMPRGVDMSAVEMLEDMPSPPPVGRPLGKAPASSAEIRRKLSISTADLHQKRSVSTADLHRKPSVSTAASHRKVPATAASQHGKAPSPVYQHTKTPISTASSAGTDPPNRIHALLSSRAADPVLSPQEAVALRNSSCLRPTHLRKYHSVEVLRAALANWPPEQHPPEQSAQPRTIHARLARPDPPSIVLSSPTSINPRPLLLEGAEFEPHSISPSPLLPTKGPRRRTPLPTRIPQPARPGRARTATLPRTDAGRVRTSKVSSKVCAP